MEMDPVSADRHTCFSGRTIAFTPYTQAPRAWMPLDGKFAQFAGILCELTD
jgi:hypothetical protein